MGGVLSSMSESDYSTLIKLLQAAYPPVTSPPTTNPPTVTQIIEVIDSETVYDGESNLGQLPTAQAPTKPPTSTFTTPSPTFITTFAPTFVPTTLAPTTFAPTTFAPTTLAPTTFVPTKPVTYDPNNNLKKYYDLLYDNVYNIANKPNEDIDVVKWNTYYYKKYKSQNNILLFIIFVCIFIILLKLLHRHNSYFDETAYSTVLGITIALSIIVVSYMLLEIYYKDELNFDETNYSYNMNKAKVDSIQTDISDNQFQFADTCSPYNPANIVNNLFKNIF